MISQPVFKSLFGVRLFSHRCSPWSFTGQITDWEGAGPFSSIINDLLLRKKLFRMIECAFVNKTFIKILVI